MNCDKCGESSKTGLSCAIRARRQGYFKQKEIFKEKKIGIISQILLVVSKKGIGRIMDGKIIFSSGRVQCSRSQ